MNIPSRLLTRTLDGMNDDGLKAYVEIALRAAVNASGLDSPRAKRLLNVLVNAATKVQSEL